MSVKDNLKISFLFLIYYRVGMHVCMHFDNCYNFDSCLWNYMIRMDISMYYLYVNSI